MKIGKHILGDPGADSGGEGKSKRATKKIGEEKSRARGIAGKHYTGSVWPPPPVKVGSRKSEVGSRNSEVGSRNSEVGSQKSEVGSRKSEVGSRSF